MLQPYPTRRRLPRATRPAEREVAWLQAVILGVRQIRGEMNIKPSRSASRVLLQDARRAGRGATPSATAPASSASPASRA